MQNQTSSNVQAQAQDKGNVFHQAMIILIPFLIIAGFIIVTIVTIKANQKPKERRRNFNTLAVMADYAVRDNVQLSVNTQGEARPQTEIDFVPQVGGKIVYVSPNFIEGGIFKKGEVLIRLEDADFKVAMVRAEANVAQAQQTLVREIAEGEIARQDYAELSLQGFLWDGYSRLMSSKSACRSLIMIYQK
jgi:multidrug efflux pump subunit AcrA (membrane-fusion protein)